MSRKIHLTADAIRALAGRGARTTDEWRGLLADDAGLRLGPRQRLHGRAAVEPALARFLAQVVVFGRCGCDVLGSTDHWLIETDLTFRGGGLQCHPCVVSIRTDGQRVRDLRFYLDLSHVPVSALDE